MPVCLPTPSCGRWRELHLRCAADIATLRSGWGSVRAVLQGSWPALLTRNPDLHRLTSGTGGRDDHSVNLDLRRQDGARLCAGPAIAVRGTGSPALVGTDARVPVLSHDMVSAIDIDRVAREQFGVV